MLHRHTRQFANLESIHWAFVANDFPAATLPKGVSLESHLIPIRNLTQRCRFSRRRGCLPACVRRPIYIGHFRKVAGQRPISGEAGFSQAKGTPGLL